MSPAEVLAIGDPGDETQRNFRYQHGYGSILLIAGFSGSLSYKAIWCEHHEDVLAECNDSKFEAFQIKTRRPENGDWDLTDDEVKRSIHRFVKLHLQFGNAITKYAIVSNAEFMKCRWDIADRKKLKKSLVLLLDSVALSDGAPMTPFLFADVLTSLSEELKCSENDLLAILKKTQLIKGPPRDNFDTDISHNHLTKCSGCTHMDRATLNKIRDEIIQRVYLASSLQIDNPLQHLPIENAVAQTVMEGKRLTVDVVQECISGKGEVVFRYQPYETTLSLESQSEGKPVLQQKMEKGGLENMLKTMTRRVLSTEQSLLEKGYEPGGDTIKLLTQLESVVQAEFDEAENEVMLELKPDTPDYGRLVYAKFSARLKDLVTRTPELVAYQPYESLIGIGGLLTENCSIWWSEKFKIDAA